MGSCAQLAAQNNLTEIPMHVCRARHSFVGVSLSVAVFTSFLLLYVCAFNFVPSGIRAAARDVQDRVARL